MIRSVWLFLILACFSGSSALAQWTTPYYGIPCGVEDSGSFISVSCQVGATSTINSNQYSANAIGTGVYCPEPTEAFANGGLLGPGPGEGVLLASAGIEWFPYIYKYGWVVFDAEGNSDGDYQSYDEIYCSWLSVW